jgi:hypothetical protein
MHQPLRPHLGALLKPRFLLLVESLPADLGPRTVPDLVHQVLMYLRLEAHLMVSVQIVQQILHHLESQVVVLPVTTHLEATKDQ